MSTCQLTNEERAVLAGSLGETMAKVMRTVVAYANVLGAPRLADIEGDGHFSIGDIIPGLGPRKEMLEELVSAGLRTKYPFTIDPLGPVDYENFFLTPEQEPFFRSLKSRTEEHMALYEKLGLRPVDNFTCTPYFPEIGNTPARGATLAWSESSCVIYANSVLGARTNRNAVTFDLLSNIAGKTPYCGLLTDDGRRADWHVRVDTSTLPPAQLLGGFIGRTVVADVPYITGLDQFLGRGMSEVTRDYLKEFGAACAAIGAVGLYHVDGITPEACDTGKALLRENASELVITDAALEKARADFPMMWSNPEKGPVKALMGCPHYSLRELHAWKDRLKAALAASGRKRVALPTVMCASPTVIALFEQDTDAYRALTGMGVVLSPACIEGYMNNPLCAAENIATTSNKLRDISTAKYYTDDEMLALLTGTGGGGEAAYGV